MHEPYRTDTLDIGSVHVPVFRAGQGNVVVYLHSMFGENCWLPYTRSLSETCELFMPTHAGFGDSAGFEQFDSVEDLVYLYLDMFEAAGWEQIDLIGSSFGGWVAAEIAARSPRAVRRLILADPLGLWVDEHPVSEVFGLDDRRLVDLVFQNKAADPFIAQFLVSPVLKAAGMQGPNSVPLYKNLAAVARYGWNPYLHNPKMDRLLRRIRAPTLVIWGSGDRVIGPAYGAAFKSRIPNAQLASIDAAGHLPMIEQPAAFCQLVRDFLAN